MSFATAHLDRLVLCDPSVYGRACAIVRLAAEAWRCSVDCLIETWRAPHIDAIRSALTVVLREQTALSLDDIGMVLNREDHSSMQFRIKRARAGLFRKLEPFFSAYWSLIGFMRGRIELQGNPSIAEHPYELKKVDLSAYLCKPAGVWSAREISETVASVLGVDHGEIRQPGKRSSDASIARSIVFYLFKLHLTDFSYPQMARALHLKSHSSVYTSIQNLERRIVEEGDEDLLDRLVRCADALKIDLSESLPAALLQRAVSPSAAPDASAGPRTGTTLPEDRSGLEGVSNTQRITRSVSASIRSESTEEAL